MRGVVIIILVFCSALLSAQSSIPINPWESVAPGGSTVYTDIKEASKNADQAYRLEITGGEQFLDKKFATKVSSLHSLMALRIKDNGLNNFPNEFLRLRTVVFLSSSGNAFTSLPDSMGMMSNLKYLELHQTNFDTIPEGVYGLPRLQSLTIGNNKDTICFTSSVKYFSRSLVELRLYSTLFDTLPEEFSHMNALSKLVMYKCKLYDVPEPVTNLANLSELWLDSNYISVVPPAIAKMQGLTYLSLRGNRISKVTSSICFLKNLVVLDLRGNPMDPYEVSIVQALLPNTRVLF
jgi:Leucine-rich repeat (LRR) protein